MAASAEADERVRHHLAGFVERARTRAAERLLGIVLGGSLARGQGVVLRHAGELRLLSDIDLYLVMESLHPEMDGQLLTELRAMAAADPFLAAPCDLGIVEDDYFGRLGATLPARQLAHGSQILWSAGDRAWTPPPQNDAPGGATPIDVDADDALLLILNRIIESLLLGRRALQAEPDPFALYHRWKLWIDAPLAWLSAHGHYRPGRAEQLAQLDALSAAMDEPAASWLRAGLDRVRRIGEALSKAPLELEHLAIRNEFEPPLETLPRDWALKPDRHTLQGRAGLVRWVWPFLRSSMDRCLGSSKLDAGASLSKAHAQGAPGELDRTRCSRWLRRRGWMMRMRTARRWAPLSPRPITGWWAHGIGGSGPERIYIAAALRFAGLEEWRQPLEGLLINTHGMTSIPRDPERIDRWLGEMWSGWLMGGARS